MTSRTRPGKSLLVAAIALTLGLPGCFGSSDDKGDNGGSMITPKPGNVQDANTAGSSKTPLPDPSQPKDGGTPAVAPPK